MGTSRALPGELKYLPAEVRVMICHYALGDAWVEDRPVYAWARK